MFATIFGYELAVDPRVHEGICLKKSASNGAHDGEAINCPVPDVEEGYVYQKLIRSSLINTL